MVQKRFLSSVMALAMIVCLLSGCSESEQQNENTGAALEKIADNLYEISYTDDFDWGNTAVTAEGSFACAGVQNGQYRGRNYDWIYADTDLCVVHASVTDNRPHASVGVADLSFVEEDENTIYDLDSIPFKTVDGINDAGVCIQINVMPYGENGTIDHTEAAEDDLSGPYLVRYILDYAGSVEEALELLNERDIHSEWGEYDEYHWMLSGPASETDDTIKTVVLEVFPDGLHVTEDFVDDKPIMANFNVSNFDGTPESVGIGLGYERWQILDECYDEANSVMGTFDLMEKAHFSELYNLYGDRFWYSEYNGMDLSEYYDEETLKELLGEDVYNYYMENYGGVYYTSALWDGETVINGDISKTGILSPLVEADEEAYAAQNNEDGSLWITVHTAVYDLENLTLDIQVRESQDHLHFTID